MNQRLQNTAFYARMPYYSGHRKAWRGLPKSPKREPFNYYELLGGVGAFGANIILASDPWSRRERPNP